MTNLLIITGELWRSCPQILSEIFRMKRMQQDLSLVCSRWIKKNYDCMAAERTSRNWTGPYFHWRLELALPNLWMRGEEKSDGDDNLYHFAWTPGLLQTVEYAHGLMENHLKPKELIKCKNVNKNNISKFRSSLVSLRI